MIVPRYQPRDQAKVPASVRRAAQDGEEYHSPEHALALAPELQVWASDFSMRLAVRCEPRAQYLPTQPSTL